jgi:hypothetical protein
MSFIAESGQKKSDPPIRPRSSRHGFADRQELVRTAQMGWWLATIDGSASEARAQKWIADGGPAGVKKPTAR